MKPFVHKAMTLAALVLLAACSDRAPTSDIAAVPGEIVITLRSSAPAIGAIRFTITGGEIAQVTVADPSATVFVDRTAKPVSMIVIGETLQGALVRVSVPDVRAAARYRLEVLEVVDTGNRSVPAIDDYGLSVSVAGTVSRR